MSSKNDVINTIGAVYQGYNIIGGIIVGMLGLFFLNLAYTFAYIDPLDDTKKTEKPQFSNVVLIFLAVGSIALFGGISNTLGWFNYSNK
jgi:hypothetical protein